MRVISKNAEAWTADKVPESEIPSAWPHEVMVKLFSSRSHSEISARFLDLQCAEVLDIGCYYGNQTRFFKERGHRCVGVEVTDDMVAKAKQNNPDIPVLLGTNRSLPVESGRFDLVISLNTIHYDCGNDVAAALREFKRVTKPGGIVFIETAGDRHMIRDGAVRLGPLNWRPNFGDFRNDTEAGYGLFDSLEHFQDVVTGVFSRSEFGRSLEEYPKRTVDFFFAVCEA
jgi:SAM-dependent methyltransferase